jgi:hypothetical protein
MPPQSNCDHKWLQDPTPVKITRRTGEEVIYISAQRDDTAWYAATTPLGKEKFSAAAARLEAYFSTYLSDVYPLKVDAARSCPIHSPHVREVGINT